jgi:hypothetical protein
MPPHLSRHITHKYSLNEKALIAATTFALMLVYSTAAPFGTSYSGGIQLVDKAAAAGSHKQMKDKKKKVR